MRTKSAFLTLIICTGVLRAQQQAPVKHIRVIMDTSQSLHRTDPNGYVKTATAMLYDLSWQLLDVKDTFKVVMFDPKWPAQQEPPTTVGEQIEPVRSETGRTAFVRKMLDTEYDSPQTYFSPGMSWSFDDLEKRVGASDQKIIVLVTDGLPDHLTIHDDGEKLKALVPKLAKEKIKVYVLAFGPGVDENWFQDVFHFNASDGVTGQLFVGKTADKLLANMLDIFAQSFGYTKNNSLSNTTIDVAGGTEHDKAVVVALYGPGQGPGFQLTMPSGRAVGETGLYKVLGKADSKGKPTAGVPVSYAYQWMRQPALGDYAVKPLGGTPEQIAVLYPGGFSITLRQAGNNPIDAVMAGKRAPMQVVVTPASGIGDVEGKTINYHLHYVSKDDEGTTADATINPPEKSPKGGFEGEYVKGVGRVFNIYPAFVRDPPHSLPGTAYQGYIDIQVTPVDSNTVLAETGNKNMYPVLVYPYVSLHPTPPEVTLTNGSQDKLHNGDNVCTSFRFQLQGESNNLRERDYSLGMRIDPPLALSGAWRGARFWFDGQQINAASNSLWQATTAFDPSRIGSENHKLCVQIGSPTAAADSALTIRFGVWPSSDLRYQSLNVVDDLTAHFKIEAPDFWQIWKPWLMWLVTLLLLYLTYLFFRTRASLPPDLAVSLAQGGGKLTPAKLGEGSLGSRWLGMAQSRPIYSLAGDRELGSVYPAQEDLFVFLPAKGYGLLMQEKDGEWSPLEARADGSWLLEAGQKYRAGVNNDESYFRFEYTESRPKI